MRVVVDMLCHRPVKQQVKLTLDTQFWLHVRFEMKISLWIEIDVSPHVVLAFHHIFWVQLQFDVRVYATCHQKTSNALATLSNCIGLTESWKLKSTTTKLNSGGSYAVCL